ncbi:hypothetical protein EPO17_03805 [Patescibacteria group bacterium]|nr:MAG: hypothetical protein EPO17_03805 [Patescibacteria group bacterium]
MPGWNVVSYNDAGYSEMKNREHGIRVQVRVILPGIEDQIYPRFYVVLEKTIPESEVDRFNNYNLGLKMSAKGARGGLSNPHIIPTGTVLYSLSLEDPQGFIKVIKQAIAASQELSEV